MTQPPINRPPTSNRRSAAWFVAVGCTAAAVHWSIAVGLVALGGWPPLLANVVGWLVALGVSFGGHHGLSFAGHRAPLRQAAPRFALVSGMGFLVNELSYALLLRLAPEHYGAWLALVLVLMAGLTYLLARHWAFAGKAAP
tara:strand:- start:425 stop:847 length:423 start_codon:yes stop_codon:yes gene_type:complete